MEKLDHDTEESKKESPPEAGVLHTVRTKVFEQRGLLAAFLASLCFALQTVWVKLMKDAMPVVEVVCIRFALQGMFSLMFGMFTKMSILPDSKREMALLAARGSLGTIAIGLIYFAVYNMSAGLVNTIVFGAPVFVGILAWIFLKERFYCCDAILMAVDILGIVLIAQPPFLFSSESWSDSKKMELFGAIAAFCAMLLAASTAILIRLMGLMGTSAIKIVFYYSIIGTLLPVIIGIIMGDWVLPQCGTMRFLLVGIGFMNFAAQSLMSYALAVSKQSYFASIINSNQVPATIILELFILGVSPDWISGIGIFLVLCSAFGVVLRERSIIKNREQMEKEGATSGPSEGEDNVI